MKFESQSLNLNLFEFVCYRQFLNTFFYLLKSYNTKYSLKYLSNRMGLRSSSSLSMILKGERNPSYELTQKISKLLKLNKKESEYFHGLVKLEKNNIPEEERVKLVNQLKKENSSINSHTVDIETFEIISNWYYFAIRQLMLRDDFKCDVKWIYQKLRRKVTVEKIKEALINLEKKNLIQIKDKKISLTRKELSTSRDIPHEALKRHHEQMIDRAKESIRDVDVQKRDIGGTTFNIDENQIEEMKDELNEFRNYFYKKYEVEKGNSTYQINIQLFPLADS